jgi:hypothetical protein
MDWIKADSDVTRFFKLVDETQHIVQNDSERNRSTACLDDPA